MWSLYIYFVNSSLTANLYTSVPLQLIQYACTTTQQGWSGEQRLPGPASDYRCGLTSTSPRYDRRPNCSKAETAQGRLTQRADHRLDTVVLRAHRFVLAPGDIIGTCGVQGAGGLDACGLEMEREETRYGRELHCCEKHPSE